MRVVTHQDKRRDQKSGADVRHDNIDRARLNRSFVGSIENNEKVRNQRHHFPGNEEREGVTYGNYQEHSRDKGSQKKPGKYYFRGRVFPSKVTRGVDR